MTIRERLARSKMRGLLRDEHGFSAVEFALILPIALVTLFCEFNFCEALSVSRKAAITGRSLTDLIARRPSVSSADVTTMLNASAQIMAPYSTSDLSVVVAQLTTDANNVTSVSWSRALNGTALTTGASFTPPTGMARASTSLIYAYVRYIYRPSFSYGAYTTYPVSFTFYLNPRVTSSVPLTN